MNLNHSIQSPSWLTVAVLLLVTSAWRAAAAPLTARAGVSASDVFVGEAFRFQIQISGSDQPEQPDLSALRDFSVQFQGGGANNRSSVTIINGQMTQNVQTGYILNYALTPKRPGNLVIPSVTVRAEGQTVQTQPIGIVANTPVEADNFKLRMALSKPRAYVGEPLVLEVTFYYSAGADEPKLTLPLLQDNNYVIYDLPADDSAPNQVNLGGKSFQTMRLRKVIIPKVAGSTTIAGATLAFQGVIGYRTVRDFFGRAVRQPSYKRFVIPSNDLKLDVLNVPVEGRPPGFAGHIGEYQISATATPTEVSVGDPITLTVALSGPPYLDHIELPPLQQQPALADKFKIPSERESGKVQGEYKYFTQTIRALRDDIAEIPPIDLPYFDTAAGEYRIARSAPIPIKVKSTKVLTASDAEGLTPVDRTSEVEGWKEGIAYNYEDLDVIVDQRFGPGKWLRSPAWLATIVMPPAAYLGLFLTLTFVRKRNADPQAVRARRAFGELSRKLKSAAADPSSGELDLVLNALRGYLGDKLRMSSGALTFKDVSEPLTARGVDAETLGKIKELFQRCEAGRYAGGAETAAGSAADQCLELAQELEGTLK